MKEKLALFGIAALCAVMLGNHFGNELTAAPRRAQEEFQRREDARIKTERSQRDAKLVEETRRNKEALQRLDNYLDDIRNQRK